MKDLEYYMSLPYQEIIKSSSDGGYVGICPELPGCITQVESLDEMKEMLEDAKRCWISSMLEDGYPVPEPEPWELYDGSLNIKIPSSLHRRLAAQAEAEKITANTLAARLVEQGMKECNYTEYLSSIPGVKEKIITGMNTPLEECVADEEQSLGVDNDSAK